jgi:hypothetical protein
VNETRARLDSRDARANWIRHASAIRVVREVFSAMAAEGIAALLVKGAATAHLLYEDATERSISDIDVRIRKKDFRRAVRLAQARGWHAEMAVPALWEAMLTVEGCNVDLECTVGPPGLCALTIEDLLDSAERHTEPFGVLHRQPEIHDHALILVLNAFKDGLRPMPWAREDLVRIVRHERFEGQRLIARARRGRVVSALWIVANWLAEDHGVPEWGTIRESIGPSAPSKRVRTVYREVQKLGWPSKAGLLASACSNDTLRGALAGFGLTAAAVIRRRALLAMSGKPAQ